LTVLVKVLSRTDIVVEAMADLDESRAQSRIGDDEVRDEEVRCVVGQYCVGERERGGLQTKAD